eukprot:1003380-Pyramimonas_sp.AAC.2
MIICPVTPSGVTIRGRSASARELKEQIQKQTKGPSRIQDPGSRIQAPEFRIQNPIQIQKRKKGPIGKWTQGQRSGRAIKALHAGTSA